MEKEDIARLKKIQDIVAQAQAHVVADGRTIFQAFGQEFFFFLATEDLYDKPKDYWVQAVTQLWDFFQERSAGILKVRAYNQCVHTADTASSQGILDIIADDMPFLVDSVLGVLESAKLKAHLVIHPVLRVQRDGRGQLNFYCVPRDSNCEGSPEALMRFELTQPLTSDQQESLEKEVHETLRLVRMACEDWGQMCTRLQDACQALDQHDPVYANELKDFLRWLDQGNYTFIGHCLYDVAPGKQAVAHSGLGVLRSCCADHVVRLFAGQPEKVLRSDVPLSMVKTGARSLVRRRDLMDCVAVHQGGAPGQTERFHLFFGLFTSRAYVSKASCVPIVRQKIGRVLEQSGLLPVWYNTKALKKILESLPRDELFYRTVEELLPLSVSILQLQERSQIRVFTRFDPFERYISCLVYVPRDHYSTDLREKMGSILEKTFSGHVDACTVRLADVSYARVHYTIGISGTAGLSYDLKALEEELFQATLTWKDFLRVACVAKKGAVTGERLFARFQGSFSSGYQERFSVEEALKDIDSLEQALETQSVVLRLCPPVKDVFSIILYSPLGMLVLSEVVPIFERMGLIVLTEDSFHIHQAQQPCWMHAFGVTLSTPTPWAVVERHLPTAFLKTLSRDLENDTFNRLVLLADLPWRDCALIRALACYLKQLELPFNLSYLAEILSKHPQSVRLLVDLFHTQFDPALPDREEVLKSLLDRLQDNLRHITHNDANYILHRLSNLIRAMVRTNFYQRTAHNEPKPYISLKFSCQKIDDLAAPLPLYEVFVYTPRGEGLHLRGGKVARGGIRWSDRTEDYRREVKDLWKTQTVKNAVVVPAGAKGAFIVKNQSFLDQEEKNQAGLDFYQVFMKALLEITDNWVDGKVVPPPAVVRRDEDDPYLVVAADKGTSTFSDYANALAHKHQFWIGDAFAAGGSAGYDHKKMGITARGAWKSVLHHFAQLGLDVQKDPITVVGVGDMSGDVFGNGMLLSSALKLVAAFNHLHIFIDPNPDPLTSFQERQRLFRLPQSTWADYDPAFLSPGGCIFSRSSRQIELSPEIQCAFHIEQKHITPDALIQILLKSAVDLLWFGGIGTFIKAVDESHGEVMDRANEGVRVNACAVRARVIAEGANLGCTQRGRVAYALGGGLINMDALDNSGGVNCSDHEVNIKILFQSLIKEGVLTEKDRNSWLEEMQEEVAALVLHNNVVQNQAIDQELTHAAQQLCAHERLICQLEEAGHLCRTLEALPDEQELSRRRAVSVGLTRPELFVLSSYSKMYIVQHLMTSPFLEDPFCLSWLENYFPYRLRQTFPQHIFKHPLRREIIATCITNHIVDRFGMTMVLQIARLTDHPLDQIIKATLIVEAIVLAAKPPRDTFMVCDWVMWFLNEEDMTQPVVYFLDLYGAGLETILESLAAQGAPSQESTTLPEWCYSWGNIVQCAQQSAVPVHKVASVYEAVGVTLRAGRVYNLLSTLPRETCAQQQAHRAVCAEMMNLQRLLTKAFLVSGASPSLQTLERWLREHMGTRFLCYQKALDVLCHAPLSDWAPVLLFVRQLCSLHYQNV